MHRWPAKGNACARDPPHVLQLLEPPRRRRLALLDARHAAYNPEDHPDLIRSFLLGAANRGKYSMSIIKLHYDGWLVLPAALREALGLKSGDRLAAALVDGTLVLRPVAQVRRTAAGRDAAMAGTGSDPQPPPGADELVPVRRQVGRPRKATPATGEGNPGPRPRGRPRKTARADDTATMPAAPPDLGPPRLRTKAEREAGVPAQETATPAVRPALPIRPEPGFQPVERRPFRNVEVRQLGPGRGHHRDRGPQTGPRSR